MNKNLNLSEILKDCPKGTKFYSTIYGYVYFDCIDLLSPYPVTFKTFKGEMAAVTNSGLNHSKYNGECTFFPSREQRDWSKWHIPFKDGDVVYANVYDISYILIYHKQEGNTIYRHVCFCLETNTLSYDDRIFTKDPVRELRYVSEEEKQLFFDAIREKGYKWNAKTKTLEKLSDSKFKDGDILVYSDTVDTTIFIHRKKDNERTFTTSFYVALKCTNNELLIRNRYLLIALNEDSPTRLATEEEKQKLFDAIKEHGYRWDAEKKVLKELSDSKFKDGDIIFTRSEVGNHWVSIFKRNIDEKCETYVDLNVKNNNFFDNTIYLCSISEIIYQRLATKEEKKLLFEAISKRGYRWNSETKTLEKLIALKFKVGDSVQLKTDNNDKFTITTIDDNKFYYGCGNGHEFMIPVVKQDNWELVPNKFDPKTLEPFDKVFMTDSLAIPWSIGFFSHILERGEHLFAVGSSHWRYCIPYNNDTKHLIGKIDGAPAFYRYWEK